MKPISLEYSPGYSPEKIQRLQELTRKIIQVCSGCAHLKWRGGPTCDRKKSECHSSRVRKWLKELEEIG